MVNSLNRSFKPFNWWGIELNLQCEGKGGINTHINNKIKHMDIVLPWLPFDDYYNFFFENELISTHVCNATAEFIFSLMETLRLTVQTQWANSRLYFTQKGYNISQISWLISNYFISHVKEKMCFCPNALKRGKHLFSKISCFNSWLIVSTIISIQFFQSMTRSRWNE